MVWKEEGILNVEVIKLVQRRISLIYLRPLPLCRMASGYCLACQP